MTSKPDPARNGKFLLRDIENGYQLGQLNQLKVTKTRQGKDYKRLNLTYTERMTFRYRNPHMYYTIISQP